jgi:trimethylamine-N-oxide reductase (cytochrome c)
VDQEQVATRYPLSLNTSHPTQRLHSQLDNTPLRDKFAVADREAILIHPDDAKARGIQDGDLVRAFNDRGQILVGASRTTSAQGGAGVRRGLVDPAKPGERGSVQERQRQLPHLRRSSSSLAQGNCGHMAQLQIEKYQGPAPVNTAHAVPANG